MNKNLPTKQTKRNKEKRHGEPPYSMNIYFYRYNQKFQPSIENSFPGTFLLQIDMFLQTDKKHRSFD